MAKSALPCPTVLRQLLRYEVDTGKLFWKERDLSFFKTDRDRDAWNTRYAGQEAMTAKNKHGYKRGCLLGNDVLSHRVVWAMNVGRWPSCHIDHINRDTGDNRLKNLREASHADNMRNSVRSGDFSSNFRGVSWRKDINKWKASIQVGGRSRYLGTFDQEAKAAVAYDKAARIFHGRFASVNFPEKGGKDGK